MWGSLYGLAQRDDLPEENLPQNWMSALRAVVPSRWNRKSSTSCSSFNYSIFSLKKLSSSVLYRSEFTVTVMPLVKILKLGNAYLLTIPYTGIVGPRSLSWNFRWFFSCPVLQARGTLKRQLQIRYFQRKFHRWMRVSFLPVTWQLLITTPFSSPNEMHLTLLRLHATRVLELCRV